MSTKLDFNEIDLLNATWSGMKALQAKTSKDAMDANAISKGASAITKFMETKLRWTKHLEQSPKALQKASIYLT